MKRENLLRNAERAIFTSMPELLRKAHSHALAFMSLM
jgi:hypothetical protein